MSSSANLWVVNRIQHICNNANHKSHIDGLFKLSKRSQRDDFSEKRISRVYYTSELRFWGVFCVNYDKINIIIKRKQV